MAQTTAYGLPSEIDLLVVGGGTSGAALAGIVARDTDQHVVLLEAGPDYGPLDSGRWPAELLDARRIPSSHQWEYSGIAHPSHQHQTAYDRARVIGGCSAHNGCVALLGHRRDYDAWAELGNPGWGWDDVAPAFERAKAGLRVRSVASDEVTPWHRAFIDGAIKAGIPRSPDMNDPDEMAGVDASPVNIHDGIRWNTALGYLDPVRSRRNLTVIGESLVDRVELRGGRAVAVHAFIAGAPVRLEARRIVLAAGAYGSPAILMRSGIGAEDALRPHGIAPVHLLPGVGQALADHPAVSLAYRPTERLRALMQSFGQTHWMPDEQALAKARSSGCREAFDLHIYSVAYGRHDDPERYTVSVSSVYPRSAGSIQLSSADPAAPPRIEHNYLSDLDGEDHRVLREGIEIAREIMATPIGAGLVAEELAPGPNADLDAFIAQDVGIYYHPACSCRMGPSDDPLAVVDATGKVHGIDDLFVCDASIFPVLMRANTNLPAAMLAEHLASVIGRRD